MRSAQGGNDHDFIFSATGNCKYVASRLAQAEGQETLSIVDCIRDGRYAFEDEVIGIVSPTYFWGLPSIVGEFLGKEPSDGTARN